MQGATCRRWLYLFKYSEFGFVGGIQIQFLPQSNFLQSTLLLLLLPLLSDKIIYNQLFLFAIWFVFQFVVVFVFFGGIQIQFSCLIRFSTETDQITAADHPKNTTHVTMAKVEPGRQIIARSEFNKESHQPSNSFANWHTAVWWARSWQRDRIVKHFGCKVFVFVYLCIYVFVYLYLWCGRGLWSFY